ncbi:MAG: SDR family NAD(P)-dependent oxidoreductase, partial [Acidobacteriota bacterium]|nr:SDR family NAD(P)-dependent oxidoreductase [Acidobacteriota bacterium]
TSLPRADAGIAEPAHLLDNAGRLWAAGLPIDWKAFHSGERRRRVSLPTYPFEKQRYFLEPDSRGELAVSHSQKQPGSGWFYSPSWQRSELAGQRRTVRSCLFPASSDPFAEELRTALEAAGVAAATDGDHHDVLFLASAGRDEVWSCVELVQVLGQRGTPVRLTIITQGACEVTGAEDLRPHHAALLGLSRSIPLEFPSITVTVVDLDSATPSAVNAVSELLRDSPDRVVCYRGRFRWTEHEQPVKAGDLQQDASAWRTDGFYLITGGTGSIGRELARYLRSATGRKVIAVSRTGGDAAADVSSAAQMRHAIETSETRWGPLRGVIHAAGVQVARPLAKISRDEVAEQFQAKLAGLEALAEVIEGKDLDFRVVVSSLASVLGVHGFGAYSAAHAAMDCLARQLSRNVSARWLCVNIDNWITADSAPSARFFMNREEGLDVVSKLIRSREHGQIIVSTGDLASRKRETRRHEAVVESGAGHERPELQSAYAGPRNGNESVLAEIWQRLLGIQRIGIHDNFFDLGGDSVVGIQIVAQANQRGLRLTPRQIFSNQTIAELAAVSGAAVSGPADQSPMTGALPLIPIQRWFFEQHFPEPNHFNQAMMLQARCQLAPSGVRAAWKRILLHHDALRMRFRRSGVEWEAWTEPPQDDAADSAFLTVDLSPVSDADLQQAIEEHAARLQKTLDIEHGPLARLALFSCGRRPARLLAIVHHLAIDLVSWRVVLEDLTSALSGQAAFPPKSNSFQQWAERLHPHARSGGFDGEAGYWRGQSMASQDRLPLDFAPEPGCMAERFAAVARCELSMRATETLLRELPKIHGTQINDILLTALARTIGHWTSAASTVIDFEGSGRDGLFEDIDLSRTAGWFTPVYPVRLSPDSIHGIKEQLRAVPNQGIGYGALRYLARNQELAKQPRPEVCFLYHGQTAMLSSGNQMFEPALESAGPPHAVDGDLTHILSVNCMIIDGKFRADLVYSRKLHRAETMERLAGRYQSDLEAIIAGQEEIAPGLSAEFGWDEDEMMQIAAAVGKTLGNSR